MPLPLAEILRERPVIGASEPMPGLAPPPAPTPPAAEPLSLEQSLVDLRRGAGMRQEAVDAALARKAETDQMRADELVRHQATSDPLQAQLTAQTSQPLPPVAAPPVLPEPPSLQVRPFLTGTPGEPAEQSLMKAVMGLSALAQMGFGAASGVPELSLRTLAGAMQGWQEGDILRGDREFANWQATVGTLQKDYANRRQVVEDIVTRNRGDVERTRIALLTELARHGASQQELQALTESDQAYFALLDRQGQVVSELGAMEGKLSLEVLARQMQAQAAAETLRHHLSTEAISRASEGRKAAAQEQTNALIERFMGGGAPSAPGGSGPGGAGAFDVVPSFGPGGAALRFEPKKLGEQAQKDLRSYDSMLNTIGEIEQTFSDDEVQAYAGLLQRGYHDVKQFAGSVIPGLSDKRFALFKTLTGRLQASAFEVGGKQLTPFEYSVVELITPTGKEMGGAIEYRAKMVGLKQFTQARRAATAFYSQRGIDPTTVPSSEWDATMKASLQAQGLNQKAGATSGDATPPAATPSGMARRIIGPDGKEYNLAPGHLLPGGYRFK